jgi:hypothetical protein
MSFGCRGHCTGSRVLLTCPLGVCSESGKCKAVGGLCYLAEYDKISRGERCYRSLPVSDVGGLYLGRALTALHVALLVVKVNGDVATLTSQFASHFGLNTPFFRSHFSVAISPCLFTVSNVKIVAP